MALSLQYRSLLAQKLPLPKLADIGFRVYSQTDEDGIILFLFAVIGATKKLFIEIGTGNGTECNCANLAITFGWHGLFIDGDAKRSPMALDSMPGILIQESFHRSFCQRWLVATISTI